MPGRTIRVTVGTSGLPNRALSEFVEFAELAVEPVGRYDTGTRNVGCRVDVADLEVYNGDITLTPGLIVQGVLLNGRFIGTGSEDTLVEDCICAGPTPGTSQNYSARGGGAGTFGGALFKWVTMDSTGREFPNSSGFEGGGYTAQFCEIMRSVDGFIVNSSYPVDWDRSRVSHGHYFAWWNDVANAVRTATFTDYGGTVRTAPFPAQSSGDTHGDGGQIARPSGSATPHKIHGCSIGHGPRPYTAAQTSNLDPTVAADYAIMAAMDADAGYNNSALIFNGYDAGHLNVLVQHNWLGGGTASVNLAPNGSDNLSGVSILDNIMDSNSGTYSILNGAGSAATISGNVKRSDGSPASVTNL